MSDNLENFWQLLDFRYNGLAIMSEWRRTLGHEAWESFQPRYALPQKKFGSLLTNPRDPTWPPYTIIHYRDGTFEAISSDGEHCIPIPPEEALLHKWNVPLFSKDIARILGVEPPAEAAQIGDRLIRLGNYRLAPGEEYPVYWLLAADMSEFRRDSPSLIFQNKTPFFLFTGTRDVWEAEIQGVMKENNNPLLALAEVLEFRDGHLVPTDEWPGAIDVFRKALHPENLTSQPEFMLAKRGAWVFRFNRVETVVDGNLIGPPFVQYLLQHPGIEFHVEKLWWAVMGPPTGLATAHLESAFADEMTGLPDSLLGGADDILDAVAKRAYEARLRELAGERKTEESNKDASALTRIDEETEVIEAALDSSGDGIHRPKKLGDPAIKLRDRIRKGIEVFIDQIEPSNPAGAQYLKNTIKRGNFMKYTPSTEIDWVLS